MAWRKPRGFALTFEQEAWKQLQHSGTVQYPSEYNGTILISADYDFFTPPTLGLAQFFKRPLLTQALHALHNQSSPCNPPRLYICPERRLQLWTTSYRQRTVR